MMHIHMQSVWWSRASSHVSWLQDRSGKGLFQPFLWGFAELLVQVLWISSSCSWAPGREDRLELKASTFCLSSKLVGPEICVLSPLKLCLKRIAEHPELEETHNCHQVQLLASHKTKPKKPNYNSECTVQMLLVLWQAWCHGCCPGEFVPCLTSC